MTNPTTPSLSSYFKPWSTDHHAWDDFKKLKGEDQVLTVIITGIVTLITLGTCTAPMFRVLTEKYDITHLPIKTGRRLSVDGDTQGPPVSRTMWGTPRRSQPIEHGDVGISINEFESPETLVTGSAQKTDSQYTKIIARFYQKRGHVIEEKDQGPLKLQKDTLFNVLSRALGSDTETILNELKTHIEENQGNLVLLYRDNIDNQGNEENESPDNEVSGDSPFNFKYFKELLTCDDVPHKLLKDYGEKGLNESTELQKMINKVRCELISGMKGVKIVLHDVVEEHQEASGLLHDPAKLTLHKAYSEINPDVLIAETERYTYSRGVTYRLGDMLRGTQHAIENQDQQVIEIVFGNVIHTTGGPFPPSPYIREVIFIQPRLIEED